MTGRRGVPENRRRGGRRPSRTVLVFGEGKSEEVYFRGFSGPGRRVAVRAVGLGTTDPDSIIRRVDRYIEELALDLKGEDRVALVLDIDADERDVFLRKAKRFSAEGIEVYASNPCFEVWLILHFERYAKCEEPVAVTERLDSATVKRTGRRYEKAVGIGRTEDMLDTAMKNAAAIQKNNGCTPEWCFDTKPSTMVHRLVETLRRFPRGRRFSPA